MWLCSQLGFFSIVRQDADTFHIRARCLADLDVLTNAIGLPEPVRSFEGSDYPWRSICDPGDLTRFFALMASSITYENFKSSIARHPTQKRKSAAYNDIHHRMVEWQDERPPS